MRISVFGLGYVGSVTAACLADMGHQVIGIDIKPEKVTAINEGRSPVVEKGLGTLIQQGVAGGRLGAISDEGRAILDSDISIIAVGTASQSDGSIDLSHIKSVCRHIGQALRAKAGYHVVVVRSTVVPGTTQGQLIPILEAESGMKMPSGFGIVVNPEFLREGNGVEDFWAPERIVIGCADPAAGDMVEVMYTGADRPIPGLCLRTDLTTAEAVKYADNAFHGLKITFANEVGSFCARLGLDGHQVMDILCLDRKLNISPHYLKPGFAFGGSCIPKDVRALVHRARGLGLHSPLLEAIIPANESHIDRAVSLVAQQGRQNIGILGITFKSGTTDTRESAVVKVIERLMETVHPGPGQGYSLRVYDPEVGREELERSLPHICPLLRPTLREVVEPSEVLVVGNFHDEFLALANGLREEQVLIDLSGSFAVGSITRGRYIRLC